jgi:hypothetical protein
MGNCCAHESKSQSQHEDRIRREQEREEAKRALEEAMKNMANGGHQMLSSFTAPYTFSPQAGRHYFKYNWPRQGSVLITSFGVRVVATGQLVEFVEGLANYSTFMCSWQPAEKSVAAAGSPSSASGNSSNGATSSNSMYQVTLDQYHSVDANTGEQTPGKNSPSCKRAQFALIPSSYPFSRLFCFLCPLVNTCPKKFLIDSHTGKFLRVLNVDDLVEEAVSLAVVAAGADKSEKEKEALHKLLLLQRDVMVKGVIDDIALMWRCFVEMWTHEEIEAGASETIWGTKCTRRKRIVYSDPAENKKILDKFYDDLFANMNPQNQQVSRPQVVLDRAVQLQVYNGLFTTDTLRCHQCSYRKFTESQITIQGRTSSRAEFEGKRWVFGKETGAGRRLQNANTAEQAWAWVRIPSE